MTVTKLNKEFGFVKTAGLDYDKESVLECIREVKTRSDYRKYGPLNDWPSMRQIEKWYGTWTNARNAARVAQRHRKEACINGFRNVPTKLYFLYFMEQGYYKIGITDQAINRRFSKKELALKEVIFVYEYSTGKEAYEAEQEWHTWLKQSDAVEYLKERPSWDTQVVSGYTECFYIK